MSALEERVERFGDRIRGREIGSESTLNKYKKWVERFEMTRETGTPTEGSLRDFDSLLVDEGNTDYPWENGRGPRPPDSYSYSSRVIAMSALKHWLRLEYDQRVRTEPQSLVLGEPKPFDPTYLPRDEIRRTIEDAPHDCERPGCQTALQAGYDAIMRAAEVVAIRSSDVEADRMLVRSVKGSRRITLGINQTTSSMLQDHMAEHSDRDKLFYNSYGRPWNNKSWSTHFRRKHHEAGFHAFARHSPIVHRLESGESFGDVYRRARHQHPSMTAKYARLVGVEPPEWAVE